MKLIIAINFAIAATLYVLGADAAERNNQTEVVQIPLKEIWAFNMPGTRDVRQLEPEYFGTPIKSEAQIKLAERSLTSQILHPLSKRADKQPNSAFIVKGAGYDALKNAHAVLAGRQQPTNSLMSDDEITVVFFSHIAGTYVHLKEIRRERDRVEIQYELVPHIDAELTFHIALVPMGKLPSGQYKTRIFLAPLDKKYSALIDSSALRKLASESVRKSFDFIVREADGGK